MRRPGLKAALRSLIAIVIPLLISGCPKPTGTHGPTPEPTSNVEVFTEAGPVRSVTAQGKTLWVATGHGLVAWDIDRKQARVLTVDDGLPGNDIRTLARGGRDVLWVGTATGIARLQKGSWTQFGDCPLGDDIEAMAASADGQVFVGGPKGLVRLQGEAWKTMFTGSSVTGLIWDAKDKTLWVGTTNHGVLHCRGTKCDHFGKRRLGSDRIQYLARADEGVLAVVGKARDHLSYRYKGRWIQYAPKPRHALTWAHFSRGKLLVATGRTAYELTERTEPESPTGPLDLNGLTTGAPEFVSRRLDKQLPRHVTVVSNALGWLWLGSRGLGVARFNGAALQYFRTNDLTQGARYLALHCPPGQGCLMATGAQLYQRHKDAWVPVPYPPEQEAVFQWIGRDRQGVLAVVRNGQGGLDVARRIGKTWKPFELKPALLSHRGPLSATFARMDPQGRLWIGLALGKGEDRRGVGVAVVDLKTSTVTIHGRGADLPQTPGSLGVHSELSGAAFVAGVTYLASRRGVIRIDANGVVRVFTENDGLKSELIQGVAVAKDGTVYIATLGGLGRYDGKAWHFVDDGGPMSSRVTSVVASPQGAIWFGSDTGLHRLKDGKVTTWDDGDGLLERKVTGVALDPRGRVWVLHRQGLSIVTPHK